VREAAAGVERRSRDRERVDVESAPGFQDVAAPVDASTAAMLLRSCPPMLVNEPPTNSVLPLSAMASTQPNRFGLALKGLTAPVPVSIAAT
jgi:hypothetical protein